MARMPVAGRVKTRLARSVGVAEAVRFYRIASRTVIRRLAGAPFWETIIAVAPDPAKSAPIWPAGVLCIPQGPGDLGRRMQRPMYHLPPGPVCVIGTDIPAVHPGDIRRAFRALGASDFVFGPATDGGFWLVGARRRPRVVEPYADIRWSSPDTLADVRGNLGALRVALTTMHSDVDDAADLRRERARFGRIVRGPGSGPGSGFGER